MKTTIRLRFEGGARIAARLTPEGGEAVDIRTDQRPEHGGEGSAPNPMELFLASLACCAGYFALTFCQRRGLPIRGLALEAVFESLPDDPLVEHVRYDIALPDDFPEKYVRPLARAVQLCPVKMHFEHPPGFSTRLLRDGRTVHEE